MNRETAREKARQLVARMTLEEKAGQLSYCAPAIPRLEIPAYNWWNEALHGVARAGTATMFPQAIALAATFDEALLRQTGDICATEGRAKYNAAVAQGDRDIYKGLTYWSPNVNIFRDPRWGRGQETYGEDPCLTARLGTAFTRGLQGDGEVLKAAACAKHFAVHSGPEATRHEFDAIASQKDMAETYLPAFEALVTEAGVEGVMGAYNRLNGEPCCSHPWLLQELLREEWGFEGYIVSDFLALRDLHTGHMVTENGAQSAARAIKAGCNLNAGDTYDRYLLEACRQGLVEEEEITRMAEYLFATRYRLGMFAPCEYDAIPYDVVECPAHLAAAEQAAAESMVLLKNDGLLPLERGKLKTIGVIGPNADSRAALIGNYHGTSSEYITVLEGVRRLAGDGVRILYAEGCALEQNRVENLARPGDRLAEARTVAEHSDVVVLCLGLDETLEGEEGDAGNSAASGDRPDLLLPKPQRELMQALAETGRPVVLCLMTGSAADLRFAEQHFSAILQLWYPGARGGKVAAELLFGERSPSGKLPVTFYKDLALLPDFTDYSMRGRTYRYLQGEPLYPFGYGLTYGDVAVSGAAIAENRPEQVTVTATVQNRGAVATGDVVQVYLQNHSSRLAPPHPVLCAFCRVQLEPGQSAQCTLTVDARAFAVVDEQGRRRQDGGDYTLHVGTCQPDRRSAALGQAAPVALQLTRAAAGVVPAASR